MARTTIPLDTKYISNIENFKPPFEEGKLYFVNDHHTIYKDGTEPFSGINQVTFVFDDEQKTIEIRFDTDFNGDGDAGKIVVPSTSIWNAVNNLETAVNTLNLSTSTIINCDKIAPGMGPFTKNTAVQLANRLDDTFEKINSILVFNDGTTSHMFQFMSSDINKYGDLSCWKEISIEPESCVQYYKDIPYLPAIGTPNTLYVLEDHDESYYWDAGTATYKMCGFNPANIELIDFNF